MLGCPKDTVAYIDVTGNPQFCNIEMPNYMQCPMGYSCRETTNNKNVCCTIESGNQFVTSIYKNLTTTTHISIKNVESIIKPPKEMEKSKITEIKQINETKHGNNQIEEIKEKSQRNKNKTQKIINKTQKSKEKLKNKTEEQETQEIEEFVDIFEISSKKIQCKPNQIYINGKCV